MNEDKKQYPSLKKEIDKEEKMVPLKYVCETTAKRIEDDIEKEITEAKTDNFSIRITGSGSVTIGRLNASTANIELTSSGNLIVNRGEVESQRVRLSSSGEYDGKNVICQTANAELTSSGNAALNVLGVLTVDLSSSGNVYYVGSPKVVYRDRSSTGRALAAP